MPCGIPIPPIPILAPIGSIAAWLKSYANTPALPSGWVECNGQTLSDADSVYNGQDIPNLNGSNYFLRGNATSGTTGGTATHTHSTPVLSHVYTTVAFPGSGTTSCVKNDLANHAAGTTGSAATLPPYHDVVWIMRVK